MTRYLQSYEVIRGANIIHLRNTRGRRVSDGSVAFVFSDESESLITNDRTNELKCRIVNIEATDMYSERRL